MRCLIFLLLLTASSSNILAERKKKKERAKQEAAAFQELKRRGHNEVGHTREAAALRNHMLRKKKMRGIIRKKEKTLTEVLFPGVTPVEYQPEDELYMFTELVQSKKTHVPFEFYDMPVCDMPVLANFRYAYTKQRKNFGARLQGVELKPAPYSLKVLHDVTCRALCEREIDPRNLKWMRKLVERLYRVHVTLDQLPVLMRSSEMNYAVRGYPVGFKAPPLHTGLQQDEYFLYNHLQFTITYQKVDDQDDGIYITGFDVHPVSINHATDGSTCNSEDEGPTNDPSTYLAMRVGSTGEDLKVTYSYSVKWEESELPWADRWDIYLLGSPDDDIHFFAVVNSLMIVLFLTGAIATILIRTLKNDISHYNEMIDDGTEETGWKMLHGDVFRPPTNHPSALAILVGTGAQVGTAFLITLISSLVGFLNPLKKGHMLTATLVLYVLSGIVGGYVSGRIFKFSGNEKGWTANAFLTAVTIPGILVSIFTVLNFFLSIQGAATAVSFLTLLALFSLWVFVSAPLVLVGAFFGQKAQKIEVPTRTKKLAREIPTPQWYSQPPLSFLLGGLLPFGSVCIELFFIMSALWLHQIYYFMGFLLAVLVILGATCAQVSVVMCYLQLCSEDHRWWWKSFGNCASAGFYLFIYSIWFLFSRLELVGALPVIVYLTYMGMISILFAIFCGSIGVLCAFKFNIMIYGALKVD